MSEPDRVSGRRSAAHGLWRRAARQDQEPVLWAPPPIRWDGRWLWRYRSIRHIERWNLRILQHLLDMCQNSLWQSGARELLPTQRYWNRGTGNGALGPGHWDRGDGANEHIRHTRLPGCCNSAHSRSREGAKPPKRFRGALCLILAAGTARETSCTSSSGLTHRHLCPRRYMPMDQT